MVRGSPLQNVLSTVCASYQRVISLQRVQTNGKRQLQSREDFRTASIGHPEPAGRARYGAGTKQSATCHPRGEWQCQGSGLVSQSSLTA